MIEQVFAVEHLSWNPYVKKLSVFLITALAGLSFLPVTNAQPVSHSITHKGIDWANIGDSSINCWREGSSSAYRADVTAFVSGNGNYSVEGLSSDIGHDANGASLIVIYDDSINSNNRDVVIFGGTVSNIPFDYPGEDLDGIPGIVRDGTGDGITDYAEACGTIVSDPCLADSDGNARIFPRIQGSDVCGVIVETGENINEERIGERVLIEPCITEADGEALNSPWYFGSECDGGFAEYTKVAVKHAYRVNSQ